MESRRISLGPTVAQQDRAMKRLYNRKRKSASIDECPPEVSLPIPLRAWVNERLENCLKIAGEKGNDGDRRSWLEDAAYFRAILRHIPR